MEKVCSQLQIVGIPQGISERVLVLALILVAFQVLDALLTTVGLSLKGGIAGEGNALLRYVMSLVGVIPALVVAKTSAVCFIAALCYLSMRVQWIELALFGLVATYFTMAIAPWTFIIATSW